MMDPRILLAMSGIAVLVGGILIGLLLRGGPGGAGGGAVDIAALREWLSGRKTYIGMVLLAANNYAARRGWIDAQMASDLNLALATLTGFAFVAKNNRIEQKVETATTAAKIAAVSRAPEPPKEGI